MKLDVNTVPEDIITSLGVNVYKWKAFLIDYVRRSVRHQEDICGHLGISSPTLVRVLRRNRIRNARLVKCKRYDCPKPYDPPCLFCYGGEEHE